MKAYTLLVQEPLLNAFKVTSKKTGTSVSELMRTAMQEFIGRCLKRGLLTEQDVKDIYFEPDKSADVTHQKLQE